jgi:hypothetical protein
VGLIFLVVAFASAGAGQSLGLVLVALIFISAGLLAPLMFLLKRGQRVYLCTEGLAHVKGGQPDVVRWDQVEAVVQAVTRQTIRVHFIPVAVITHHAYTVHRRDGRKLVFQDRWRNVEHLGTTLAREVARYLVPRAIASYSAGAPVAFGDLSVSQQGFSRRGKLLPWREYQGFQTNTGSVVIKQRGKRMSWAVIPVRRIPNFAVFLGLMDFIQRSQPAR